MINAKSAEDIAIDQSFAGHDGQNNPAAAISGNRSPEDLALDQSFAGKKITDKPARVPSSSEDAAIEQSFGVAIVTRPAADIATQPSAEPTDGDERSGSASASATKSEPEKVTPSINSAEPPLSQEAVETARTVLASGGTVHDARVSLLRRASRDSAFRNSLSPSQSKRRNESYIGLEHRDAIFRAVDSAGASL